MNPILQRMLEEDERRDRTEFLPDNMKPSQWTKYMEKQLYHAMLYFGGDWDAPLRAFRAKKELEDFWQRRWGLKQ